jgi:hypothetical protein
MPKRSPVNPMSLSEAEFSARVDARIQKLRAMPPEKMRAYMIKAGWITKEGKMPVYPMDHEPYRPATAI